MSVQSSRFSNPFAAMLVAGLMLLAVASAGCGQASGASAPPPSASAAEATPAGPTTYADWVARQGFGGSSGLNNVMKLATWLTDNAATATTFDLTSDLGDINLLAGWLDGHPATACWSTYHDRVRADLAALQTAYATAIQGLGSDASVANAISAEIVKTAKSAVDEAVPANCP